MFEAWCLFRTCFLFVGLPALFGVLCFPVWNQIPQTGEREEPPGLLSEDPDCLGHIWTHAGLPGLGWILPHEAAELEPGRREAGQCL